MAIVLSDNLKLSVEANNTMLVIPFILTNTVLIAFIFLSLHNGR